MDYLDFELHIKSDLSITSTFQNKSETSTLELSEDIKKFKDKLEMLGERIEKEHVKDFGNELRKALFKDKIEKQFKEATDFADKHSYGVRILLDIHPSLADYPWETMSNNTTCLATNIHTPIVRVLPGNNKTINLKDKIPTTLFILSNVVGAYAVDIVNEMKLIKDALPKTQQIRNLDEVEDSERANIKVEDATRDNILNAIDKHAFNIIHFVGHGTFKDDTGYLVLRNEDGTIDMADEGVISGLFQNAESLGLIILNACSTAQISSNFTGLVPKLLDIVPAVIAMRQPISHDAAKSFVRSLYSNLLSDSIEAAIQKARNGMYLDNACNGIDFSIPVLYLAHGNNKAHGGKTTGRIFIKSYSSGEPQSLIGSVQKKPSEIVVNIAELQENYSSFKETVSTIRKAKPENLLLLSRNPHLWDHAFKDFRKNCDTLIADVCRIFPTANNILSEIYGSMICKLDDLSSSITNGIMENIESSWIMVEREYELLRKSCSCIVTGDSEVN